jgi:hypothetical protein
MSMPHILLLTLPGALLGTIGGLLAARWLFMRRVKPTPTEPVDPFVSAELDRAAVKWATDTGQPPQAASLMADKLHLLYALGRRRHP